jgi:hypothetical protein
MAVAHSKTVFVSSAREDKGVAASLRTVLDEYLKSLVWMRDIDLSAGTLVVEAINVAVTEAKWFILILSSAALQCKWVKTEADLATLRAIEDE